MKMTKRLIMFLVSLFAASGILAQTLETAKQDIYYEKYQHAKIVLNTLIENGKDIPEASYWLGEIYLKQKEIDSARGVLSRGMLAAGKEENAEKEQPLVYAGWSHLLLDSGLKTEARNEMDNVLKAGKYKDSKTLWAIARANIDSKNGDSAWAIELLNIAADRDKKNPDIYLALGDAYRKMVDGGNAIVNFDKALSLNPRLAVAAYKKGKIYKTQNNTEVYVESFLNAFSIDSTYTPVLFELYAYYYQYDVVKAKKYMDAYIANAEISPEHDYMRTDLLYVSTKYNEAIDEAKKIIKRDGDDVKPRLYKLIAYSYAALGDSASALQNIEIYFQKQPPADLVAKDFELKAMLLDKINPDKSFAVAWYEKALAVQTDEKEKLSYVMKLAELQREINNREQEAHWREQVFKIKNPPSNLDIYNWGLALYYSANYIKADSVFALYEEKYPSQVYGYLWRARSSALMDTTMQKGFAVPHYKKLIEIASADTVKNKAILLKAYEYLGGYEATITKNFPASLEYFEKLLELDPANTDAGKNAQLLKKWIEEGKDTNTN